MNWKLIRIIDACLGIPLIRLVTWLSRPRAGTGARPGDPVPARILLIKFWGIGNLFMILPAIKALHRRYPAAAIDFLTLENNHAALAMTETVNNIFTIDTSSTKRFINSTLQAIRALRPKRYDIIIDFEQFARFSALLTHRIGATKTVGYNTRGQHRHDLYTDPVGYNNDIHITRSFYQLAEAAGVTEPISTGQLIGHPDEWQQKGLQLLNVIGISTTTPIAIMHIGTSENFRERRWPSDSFAQLADYLIEKCGFKVILTGLPDELHLIRQTMDHVRHEESVHNLGGRLLFVDYFSLIAAADLLISADTAAVHLASVVDTPVIGLYGPNSPHLYGPWGANGLSVYAAYDCSPCITNFNGKINTCRRPEGRGACMKAVTVEQVYTLLEEANLLPSAPSRLKKLRER